MEPVIKGAVKAYAELAMIQEVEVLALIASGDEVVRNSILALMESVA